MATMQRLIGPSFEMSLELTGRLVTTELTFALPPAREIGRLNGAPLKGLMDTSSTQLASSTETLHPVPSFQFLLTGTEALGKIQAFN